MASARFEIYPQRDCEWRWRYVSANGKCIARSNDFFPTQKNARAAIRTFCALLGISPGDSPIIY